MPRPLIPNRRERILEAARALVLERGFNAMTVQSVAAAAGVAKGAIYREFESKHAMLEALLQESTAEQQRVFAEQLRGETPLSLSEAYRIGTRLLLDDPLMTAAMLDDSSVLGSFIDEVHDGRYRERHLAVVEWIVKLQQQGRLESDVDASSLALALSSTTLGLLTAARHLGPVTRDDLEGALAAVGTMVARLER